MCPLPPTYIRTLQWMSLAFRQLHNVHICYLQFLFKLSISVSWSTNLFSLLLYIHYKSFQKISLFHQRSLSLSRSQYPTEMHLIPPHLWSSVLQPHETLGCFSQTLARVLSAWDHFLVIETKFKRLGMKLSWSNACLACTTHTEHAGARLYAQH